jgi:hypothetical protein
VALLLRLVQVAAILYLTESLQQAAAEAVVLTHHQHQHQPLVVLEVVVFGQVQQAERHLHQDKVLLVALVQVLPTIPAEEAVVLLPLVEMLQIQGLVLAVMVEQELHLVCLEFLQHTLEAVEAVVINMAQPPVLVVQVAAALAVLVGVLAVQG